ncbi:SLBB domain-containing protein [bacterium]|nr:SLBB domain-containing protein [bacterium]
MMAPSRRTAVLLAVLAFVMISAPAPAQTVSPEDLEFFQSLPQAERDRILREYGLSPETVSDQSKRDVSTPDVMMPREQVTSEVEKTLGNVPEAKEAAEAPDGVADGDTMGARPFVDYIVRPGPSEAFRDQEAQPLVVDDELLQFGYELFAGAPTTFAPATDIPVSDDYIIGPGDEVHVQLYGRSSLTTDVVVDRDGQLPFPELGPITVAGLTFREMKNLVAREVENRMIGVNVSVSMGRLRSIHIFVLGEVFQPGRYTVSGLSTMTNALFVVGGVKKVGSLRNVQLKRDGKIVRVMDLYDLLLDGDTTADERLMPGDVIFVPPVGPVVGVAGEVLRPALYEMAGPMTARGLIDLAGGLLPTAHTGLMQLDRIEDGRRVTYDLSLNGSREWVVQNGDVVKVYPILTRSENVVFLDGNVLRPGKRQHFEGMRLSDVVSSTDELLPETYFDYGLIERENNVSREPEYLSFDLGAVLLDGRPEEDIVLLPRDRVYVFHRGHFLDVSMVSIRGEVRAPGRYQYRREMRALDLILAGGGLTRDAWVGQAEIFRTDPETHDVTLLNIDLGSVLTNDPKQNIALQDQDELAVHSVWEFRQREQVEITGEVNNPGRYPLAEGMCLSDLIFVGGNLKESAYRREAELTRYEVVDGERRELHHVILDLESMLAGSGGVDLLLKPYDRLLIRRIMNWRKDEVVHVTGEIAFPGSYPVEEGERLSRVIERFGGFLSDAYLPAAVFTREQVRGIQTEQLARMTGMLEADLARLSVSNPRSASNTDIARRQVALETGNQLLTELRNAKASGRLVISLDTAERLAGTQYDIVIEDGDRLHVPKRPDFVMVMGQVNNQTAFQYQKGRRASHYVKLAGGTTRFSDSGNMYIIKADGSVQRSNRSRIEPGDVIIVPEKLEQFTGMQFMLDLSQVLYQLGLAAASAYTIGLF